MVKTIGNPLSWGTRTLGATGSHLGESARHLGGDAQKTHPRVNRLYHKDLQAALRAGWEDFLACRSDAAFVVAIYPIAGLALMATVLRLEELPLLLPLVAGFALLGPVAAVGLYEISRRRETGTSATWADALGVLKSPSIGAISLLGLYMLALFVTWMMTANAIYDATMGPEPPASIRQFLQDLFTTNAGGSMFIIGLLAGSLFAVVALAISVVSFPMLLDRNVGVPVAVVTSARVLLHNPRVILAWGGIVAAGLFLGALPFLLGLIVVMPVLGHATWHLYRRAVS